MKYASTYTCDHNDGKYLIPDDGGNYTCKSCGLYDIRPMKVLRNATHLSEVYNNLPHNGYYKYPLPNIHLKPNRRCIISNERSYKNSRQYYKYTECGDLSY